jgi:hypothetical protein
MKYQQRIVAYIDILGFKSILNDTVNKDGEDDEKKIDELIAAFASMRDVWGLDKKSEVFDKSISQSKKVTIFSDTIVISFLEGEPSEVFYTLLEIKWLIMRMLWFGVLCRGAVAIGRFIHNDEYLFGPALVEAYLLESKAALYPRIILDRSVVDAGANNTAVHHTAKMEREYVESLLEQDSDGMYYIDYFFRAQSELDDPEYDFPQYINNLGNIIRKGLMASSHPSKADLKIKYSWMRERYNRMVSVVTDKENINYFKQQGELELAEFYSQLKQISPKKNITMRSSGRVKGARR